jgi:hypothetical protein
MPIPDNYTIPVSSSDNLPLLPPDTYVVEITGLELRNDVQLYQSTETEDRFNFEFTILEEGEFKGRKQWKEVRTVMSVGWSGGNPSWLYKIFCAVNNITVSEDDANKVTAQDINSMIGRQLRIVVEQKANQKGELKNKVTNVLPLKGAPIVEQPLIEDDAEPDFSEDPDSEKIDSDDIPF